MKPRDLTGYRFGRLTALRRVEGNGMSRWFCSCDCGRNTEVFTTNLLNGRTKSCGCLRRAPAKESSMQQMMIPNEEVVEGNDVEISYNVYGSGIDAILIPGLFTDKGFWKPYVELMGGLRVTTMDNRGYGATGFNGPFSMDDLIGDVNSVMDSLGVPDAHIIGWDTGASIAHAFAMKHPSKVRSLIMLAPPVGDFERVHILYSRILDRIMMGCSDYRSLSDALEVFSSTSSQLERDVSPYHFMDGYDPLGLILQLKAVQVAEPISGFPSGIPVLIMHGTEDPLIDRHRLEKLMEDTGMELVSLQSEGHVLPPSPCVKKILSFIRTND